MELKVLKISKYFVSIGMLWLLMLPLIQVGHRLIPDSVFSFWIFVQLFDFVIEIDNYFLKIDEYFLLGTLESWAVLVSTNFGLAGALRYIDQKSGRVEIVAIITVIAIITLWLRVNIGACLYVPSVLIFFWRKYRKKNPFFIEYLLVSWALMVMI
ncbi:MAG: hypothetical protein JKY60_20495 [Kordiimonadaceae bacterium]|nr:hypothetical protein [Kordiimonadaceae bacterium]